MLSTSKLWLVDLKQSACLEFLCWHWPSLVLIILTKLYSWFQHQLSQKMLEGWSLNLARRYRKIWLINNHCHWSEIFQYFEVIPVWSERGGHLEGLQPKAILSKNPSDQPRKVKKDTTHEFITVALIGIFKPRCNFRFCNFQSFHNPHRFGLVCIITNAI